MGRAEEDITKWIGYFVESMAVSFENVIVHMEEAERKGLSDTSPLLKKLDPKQRKALELFGQFDIITSHQVGELFGFKPRTAAHLCASWVEQGFLKIVNPSNKGRTYALEDQHTLLIGSC